MSVTIEGPLRRVRRGKAVAFSDSEPDEGRTRPARIARMLAMAHAMKNLLDEQRVATCAELAIITGFSRARITQLLALTLLAPDIEEEIAFMKHTAGGGGISERHLRSLVQQARWDQQRRHWATLRKTVGPPFRDEGG